MSREPANADDRILANGRGRVLAEVLVSFAVATLAAALLYRVQSIGFVHRNLHALVGLVFLALPQVVLRRRDDARYGFTLRPLGLGLTVFAVATLLVLPLFSGGFVVFFRALCAYTPAWVPGSCARLLHPHWHLPSDFALQAAAQLLVVAVPEELFFRGYVQGRLEDAWPPRWRLAGAPVGGAWLAAAFLFALGHYLVSFEPEAWTRFFPGLLFGWMFARTRSVLAGALFHATCNLLMAFLTASLLS